MYGIQAMGKILPHRHTLAIRMLCALLRGHPMANILFLALAVWMVLRLAITQSMSGMLRTHNQSQPIQVIPEPSVALPGHLCRIAALLPLLLKMERFRYGMLIKDNFLLPLQFLVVV